MILEPIPSSGSRHAVVVDDQVVLGRGGACQIADVAISRTAALVRPGLVAGEIELTAEKGRVCVQRCVIEGRCIIKVLVNSKKPLIEVTGNRGYG